MRTIEYPGTAYKQTKLPDAPWLVSFVASAEAVLSWAGIPRRSEHNLSGFQRTEDPNRIAKAKAFFELPENQSPTALVIGIHPVPDHNTRSIELKFDGGKDDDPIRPCRLVVNFDGDALSLDDAVSTVRRQLERRLTNEDSLAQDFFDDEIELDEELDSDANDSPFDDEGYLVEGNLHDDAEIELGRSILRKLLERLDDPEWCAGQEEAIRDLAKPATIIDGQHRIKGAEQCERNIPFAICAIYDCAWPEQVFQFTVVNYAAKGIPDQFITANAALSLTKDELSVLQDRLVQANVKVIEYELMQVVEFDRRSPFHDRIDLTEKRQSNKIGYKTMVSVARAWYNARHPVFQLILPNIYPDMHKGKGLKTARLNRWKEGDWGEFFLEFWNCVFNAYKAKDSHEPGHKLWEVGHSQLVVAVVLRELQQAFLDNLNAQDEEYFELSVSTDPVADMKAKVSRRAAKFVEWLPPDFFATKWKLTSLNTGPGKSALQQALREFVDKKGKYQYVRSALITGKVER